MAFLLLGLSCFQASATDVLFNMTDVFGIVGSPANNRIVKMQSLSPFAGNYFWATSDISGNFYVSNALATTYSGVVQAPPNSINFSFYVSATNLGTIPATGITSIPANTVGTFPAGQTAYSVQAADNRYAPKGSSPFAALTAAQSTNLVQNATNGMTSIVYSNALLFAGTNLVYLTSNSLAGQIGSAGISAVTATNIATNQVYLGTNGFGTAVYSNALLFAGTNLVFLTSNSLAGQIGAAGISAVTATNIATNQVYLGTNAAGISSGLSGYVPTNRFDISGSALTNSTAATNGLGIGSGLAAMVSTNRFDVAGIAATKVAITNGISIGQSLTNSIIYSNSYIFLDAPNGGRFLSHQDEINQDYFYIQHDGGEFFLGITNGDNTSKNYIDFNIAGENEYAAAGGALPAHRFYVGPNASSLHPLFEIEGSIIRFDTNASFITRLYANGITLTNGTYLTTWYDNGAFLRSNSVPPYDWFSQATNGSFSIGTNTLSNFSVSSSGLTLMRTAGFATYAAASGRSNMMFVDNLGLVRTNDLGAFVDSIISGTAGGNAPITNAYGTNFPNGLITGQRLYYPTNFDALGGSNFLFGMIGTSSNVLSANKMNSTNGSSYGQFATNLSIGGNVGLGAAGLATNILATTNVVKFVNAGTSLATNGFFIWASSQYTNWVNGAILTNNSSAWLLITNGTTLYSLSGSSPFGVYSAVSGSVPAPLGISSFILDHNGMADVGFLSPTNILAIATNSFQAATNVASANYVLINNGVMTNGYIYNAGFQYPSAPALSIVGATPGMVVNAQGIAIGIDNTVSGSGYGAGIFGGATNSLGLSGSSVIVGGAYNVIPSSANNQDGIFSGRSNYISGVDASIITGGILNRIDTYWSSILGGVFNRIVSGDGSVSLGGYYNTNAAQGSVVLGGGTNVAAGKFSIVAGLNTRTSNTLTFAWSDGGSATPNPSPSQFVINSTNGEYLGGPLWIGQNSSSTNGGIYYLSNTFSLYAITNSMPNFARWVGNSNGTLVDIYYSNGVAIMYNLP